MNRRLAALILAAAAGLAAGAAETGSYRYRREIRVESPGWVRIRVPAEVLTRLSPTGEDLVLAGPGGQHLPLFPWTAPPREIPVAHSVALSDLRTAPGGFLAEADLGAIPRHRRVIVDLAGVGLAEGVTLEGSKDRQVWHTLARGSLFRLPPQGSLEKACLDYPPSTDRYLRLFWPAKPGAPPWKASWAEDRPKDAGIPPWKGLWVEDWPDDRPGESVTEPLRFEPSKELGGQVRFAFEVPQIQVQSPCLVASLDLTYPVRATLLVAREGYWETRAETVWLPGGEALLPVPLEAFGRPCRLVLDAGSYGAPPLRGLALRYEPWLLLFQAPVGGTYELLYGSVGRAPERAAVASLPSMPAAFAEGILGPEAEQLLPDLPAAALALGAALPDARFTYRREIGSPGTGPFSLVRLELPADLYGAARRDLGDLRLASGGKQVPYVLWSPPDPVEAAFLRSAAPKPAQERGTSLLDLDAGGSWLPLNALELSAPSAPFSRGVTLQAYQRVEPEAGFHRDGWTDIAKASWQCPGVADLPARLTLRCPPLESRRLRVVFADGDNAPLQSVDAALWRRRHVLIFPWPQEEPVELLAGANDLGPPVYDLAALGLELTARPARPASVLGGPAAATSGGEGSAIGAGAQKWLLLGALLAAAAILLAILGRSLRRPGAGQDAPEPPEGGES